MPLWTSTTFGASALSPAGVLICTTLDLEANATKADAGLSCQFDALKGRDADFRGWIKRRGIADLPPGRRVLTWSVLASGPFTPRMLAGQYKGTTGGAANTVARLRGGKDNKIVLEPVTATSQIGDRSVPSLLELRLVLTKA
jgi:hypothetical protein